MVGRGVGWPQLAVCSLWAFLGGGCSFLFVRGPDEHHARLPPDVPTKCTTGVAAPVLDTIFATNAAGATLVALTASERELPDRNTYIATGAVTTALFVGSAAYGYMSVSNCGEAKEQRLLRLLRGPGPGRDQDATSRGNEEGRERRAEEPRTEREPDEDVRAPEAEEELAPELLERWGGPEDE